MIYNGDVNIEHGGYFYSLAGFKNGYVSALRVVPCSDAGGPDNCFWIEYLTVNLLADRRQQALDCIGVDADAYKALSRSARRHVWIDASLAYGHYDQGYSEMIRIGKPDPFYSGRESEFNPNRVLRAGSSLYNYAKRQFRENQS